MDIQFVFDVYACAIYIVSYISKVQKGISELLRNACAEARKGNASIIRQILNFLAKKSHGFVVLKKIEQYLVNIVQWHTVVGHLIDCYYYMETRYKNY